MDILSKINQTKREEVLQAKKIASLESLKAQCKNIPEPRKFSEAILTKVSQKKIAVIAEIKKASPSKGLISKQFEPGLLAQSLEKGGATCLSVLTDIHYFQGHPEFIMTAKKNSHLPILRKDFIIDEYQIYQSRLWQADAILLIASSLSQNQLEDFEGIALENNLSVVIELHHEDELPKIEKLQSPFIGINNRNLKTFEVNFKQTLRLKPFIPNNKIIICESGISSHHDILHMKENNIFAFLVGENLMKQKNVAIALFELINGKQK